MLVDKNRRVARPASMTLSNYGQLRTHTELDVATRSSRGSSRGSPRHSPTDPQPEHRPEMAPNSEEIGGDDAACTLRKGLIWCCKDTLLSRWNWKERYFILTKDYLSCFKKAKSQYSDMGAFLFKLPLASLTSVEWDRLRGSSTVAIVDPKEGRLLIRSTQDVLDQWYRVLKKATEASKERRRFLRMSSTNLSTLGSGPGTPHQLRSALSDSSPAIDRLCERVEREVWGAGSSSRLMRRQKSELDAGALLRRQLHYASQRRLHNRHSMMPSEHMYGTSRKQRPDITLDVHHHQSDSLDSAGHSPSTTPSKSSMSSMEGPEVRQQRRTPSSRANSSSPAATLETNDEAQLRRTPAKVAKGAVTVDVVTGEVRPRQRIPTRGPASASASIEGGSVVLRSSSVRRRARGRLQMGAHGDQIRPHSILCNTPSDPSEVVLRRKEPSTRTRQETEERNRNRRSCDLSLLKRRSAYLTQYEN